MTGSDPIEDGLITMPSTFVPRRVPLNQYSEGMKRVGLKPLSDALAAKLETLSGKPVPSIVRRQFALETGLCSILTDWATSRQPFYVVISRGIRRSHLGHIPSMQLAQYLQSSFGCPVVFQITDDHAMMYTDPHEPQDHIESLGWLAVKQSLTSIDPPLDLSNTYVYSTLRMSGPMYPSMCKVWRTMSGYQASIWTGVQLSESVGRTAILGSAICPLLHETFAHLFESRQCYSSLRVGGAEYSWHVHIAREVVTTTPNPTTAALLTHYVPSLCDPSLRMHENTGAIFVSDEPQTIEYKLSLVSPSLMFQLLWWFSEDSDTTLDWAVSDLSVPQLREWTVDVIKSIVARWQNRLDTVKLEQPSVECQSDMGPGTFGKGGPSINDCALDLVDVVDLR